MNEQDEQYIEWYDFIKPVLWKTYKGDRIDFNFCDDYNTKQTNHIPWFKGIAMIDKNKKRYTCRCGYMTIDTHVPSKCPLCKLRKWHEEELIIFKDIPKTSDKSFIKENLTLDGTRK